MLNIVQVHISSWQYAKINVNVYLGFVDKLIKKLIFKQIVIIEMMKMIIVN